MTLIKIMFPDELQLHVNKIELEEGVMVMSVTAIREESICPHCGTASEQIHSGYQRHPADLALAGYTVCLDKFRLATQAGACQSTEMLIHFTNFAGEPLDNRNLQLAAGHGSPSVVPHTCVEPYDLLQP